MIGPLWRYARPHAPALALALFVALVLDLAALAKPWIIKHLIDGPLGTGGWDPTGVLALGLFYLSVAVAGAGLQYFQTWYLTGISQTILSTLRTDVFAHVVGKGPSFFDKNSTGRLLTRMTNDVESLGELFSGVIVNLFRDFFLIVGLVVAMVLLDPGLALVSVSSLPFIAGATVVYRVAARRNFAKVKSLIGRINGFLAENIGGMKLVQIFHREKEKYRELEDLDREYGRYSLREVTLNSFSKPFVDILTNLTLALLVWTAVRGGQGTVVEVGVLYAFITYTRQFFEPISALAEQYTTIQSALVSADRIFQILGDETAPEPASGTRTLEGLRGEIEFRGVWFAYNEENWVLKDVSFHIPAGETAAFVGTTGSGKSTIISLLARFYEPQRGQILLDGVPLAEYDIVQVRRAIGVVIQDVFLFAGDVLSNLRLFDEGISDDKAREAARQVGADRFIEALPGGWNAVVHERGASFSAGQRQLLSFARAVAFATPILVLDEATAHIDTESEALILHAMETLRRGRTSLVIAHRLSTIRNAHRIFVVQDGYIAETGTHDELSARGGLYAAALRAGGRVDPA